MREISFRGKCNLSFKRLLLFIPLSVSMNCVVRMYRIKNQHFVSRSQRASSGKRSAKQKREFFNQYKKLSVRYLFQKEQSLTRHNIKSIPILLLREAHKRKSSSYTLYNILLEKPTRR